MFSSKQEFYGYVEGLIEWLDQAGETQWASAFRDAMRISTLPSEVLGELWLSLRQFEATGIPQQLGVKDEIREVRKSLDKIIGR